MPYEARTSQVPPTEEATGVEDPQLLPRAAAGHSMRSQRQSIECRFHGQFIENILVPTDFSPGSDRALQFAVSLARQCRANLTILHVIDINAHSADGESVPAADMMKRLWETGFEQMGRLACSLTGQVDAQTAIEEGLPAERIIQMSYQADLLILASRCHKPGSKVFSKHTAQRVIDEASCPVMVVQEGIPGANWSKCPAA